MCDRIYNALATDLHEEQRFQSAQVFHNESLISAGMTWLDINGVHCQGIYMTSSFILKALVKLYKIPFLRSLQPSRVQTSAGVPYQRTLQGVQPMSTSSFLSSQTAQSYVLNEYDRNTAHDIAVDALLERLRDKLAHQGALDEQTTADLAALEAHYQNLGWLSHFNDHSHLLMAVIDLKTFQVRSVNHHLQQIIAPLLAKQVDVDSTADSTTSAWNLLELLSTAEREAFQQLYRRHVLYAVLQQYYHIQSPEFERLLNDTLLVNLSPTKEQTVQLELRLRSDRMQVKLSDPLSDEFNDLGVTPQSSRSELIGQLLAPEQVQALVDRLDLERYQVEGVLLLEGVEVTERQTIHSLIQLLIDRESVLQPRKMHRVNRLVRTLFRADNSFILSAENDQARLLMGLDNLQDEATIFPMTQLQGSHFFTAAEAGQVLNIPNLQADCPTQCEQFIQEQGVRSLLIIPLVVQSMLETSAAQSKLIGIVGLTSQQAYHFDSVDCRNAATLIPALTAALRHAIQRRFTKIHPAVEWRFVQEAERRSWGLPPETIVFNDVYPLYGISDIRGSSNERNRAIQTDLLHQFQLGIDIINAVCDSTETALGQQLKQDLDEHIAQLHEGVTVDAEVTLTRYLEQHLEKHFAYFRQCSPQALAAVEAYEAACDNDHGCVYQARQAYDQVIQQINGLLRDTWMTWQDKMQRVVKHYCDIETTDGIDHMIYVGESIDSTFKPFHLRSLRYEQLRAVCDCARVSFTLKQRFQTQLEITHLVLVQVSTVDIIHDETTERLFDVRGTRDTRYEIVKKRIDKAVDAETRTRITQPGMLTIVYSTPEEWEEYRQYVRYLQREGWVAEKISYGSVEPLQGVTGLKFARVAVCLEESDTEVC